VNFINSQPRTRKLKSEVSRSVAQPSEEDPDYWEWYIRECDVSWVSEVESRLPRPFPATFRSLISRYAFPEFAWREVLFFANTPDTIGYEGHELRIALFRDSRLFQVLSTNNYIQFGQPAAGSYDPVCFAPRRAKREDEVVRLDHEEILIRGRIRTLEVIAESFSKFIEVAAT
jgi:hypothetical protein